MTAAANIMLVEDDANLGFLLKDSLEAFGWNVTLLPDGERGLTAFHNQAFDVCVLDIMLPHKDGYQLAEEIRRYNQQIPIVFLTAKSQVDDRIKGFQSGADDYVCKPFSIEEFRYRLGAILKRAGKAQPDGANILSIGKTTLDVHNLTLTAKGVSTQLTHKEVQLLQLFIRHRNKLIERDVFLKAIWEDNGFFVARSMDVFISRLRKYLRPDPSLRIENVRGVGYVLKVE